MSDWEIDANEKQQMIPDANVFGKSHAQDFDGKIKSIKRLADVWGTISNVDEDPLLLAFIEHTKDAVIIINREQHLLAANDAAIQNWNICDKNWKPTSLESNIFAKCVNGEIVENIHHQHTREDGSIRHFILNGSPVRNHRGDIDAVIITARDVTELKTLQANADSMLIDLVQQQSSIESLMSGMPIGIIVLDTDLTILDVKGTYADYFESATSLQPGIPITEALPMIEESGILSMLRLAIETKRPVHMRNFRYEGFKHGPTYWNGSTTLVNLKYGDERREAIVMLVVDVTEEITAREQLAALASLTDLKAMEIRTEQAKLDTIIQYMPIPLIVCDRDGKLQAYNAEAKQLHDKLGYVQWVFSTDGYEVGPSLYLTDVDSEPVEAEKTPLARSLRGEICTNVILRCRTASDNSYVTLSINSAPFRDKDGEITGVVAAILDTTEQQKAQEQIEKNYLREHAIATKLQESFMARDLPDIEGFEFSQAYHPAKDAAMVGGDFYDIFCLGDGKYAIVIADVAGKGLKSAVYTAMTKFILRAYALEENSPDMVLGRLNDALFSYIPVEIFVTLVYGIIDTKTGIFTYANAGHEQPILYRADTGKAATLDVTGRALALIKGSTYSTRSLIINSNDILVLYTDGITDAGSGINRLGQERVMEVLESKASFPMDDLANSIMSAAREFAGGILADDAALFVIKALPRF